MTRKALAVHLSLSGRARLATSEIPVNDLKKDNGVEAIIDKLDSLFLPDKSWRQFSAFNKLYNLRRKSGTTVKEFICEFDHVYYEFTQKDMELPDSVIAFMLLASCSFSGNEMQLVMSAITDVQYSSMKSAIQRIFEGGIGTKTEGQENSSTPVVSIKTEPIFIAKNDGEESTYYSRTGFTRFSGRRACRPFHNNRGRGYSPVRKVGKY